VPVWAVPVAKVDEKEVVPVNFTITPKQQKELAKLFKMQ
jgi:hypothetical protein